MLVHTCMSEPTNSLTFLSYLSLGHLWVNIRCVFYKSLIVGPFWWCAAWNSYVHCTWYVLLAKNISLSSCLYRFESLWYLNRTWLPDLRRSFTSLVSYTFFGTIHKHTIDSLLAWMRALNLVFFSMSHLCNIIISTWLCLWLYFIVT